MRGSRNRLGTVTAVGAAIAFALLFFAEARAGAPQAGSVGHSGADARLPAKEQIVFLYYKDLAAAEGFFGTVLGLTKTTDLDWVKIYRTVPGSSIGCVKEGRGSLKTAADKPVMVSWVVEDVEEWYQRIVAKKVKILKPLHVSRDPAMKSFLFADPTGYTFELLEWIKPQ